MDEKLQRAIAKAITEIRTRLSISRVQLARRANLPRMDLVNLEHGSSSLSLVELNRVAEALGMTRPELIAVAREYLSSPGSAAWKKPKKKTATKKRQQQKPPSPLKLEQMHTERYLTALSVVVTKRRLELGISQQKLSTSLGVYRAYLNLVERKPVNISFALLLRFSTCLQLPLPEFIQLIEKSLGKKRPTKKAEPKSAKPQRTVTLEKTIARFNDMLKNL